MGHFGVGRGRVGGGVSFMCEVFWEGGGEGLGLGLIFSGRVFCYNLWCEGVLGWGILVGGKKGAGLGLGVVLNFFEVF